MITMKRLLSVFFTTFFFACFLISPLAKAAPISWADKEFDFKKIHSIYLDQLDLTQVTLGSHVLEMNVRDQLKESAKQTKLAVLSDVPFTYQTDAIITVSIEKYEEEVVHIPAHTTMVYVDPPFWPRRHWWHHYSAFVPVVEPAADVQCQILQLHCIMKTGDNERTIYEYEDTRYINMTNPEKDFKKIFKEMFKNIKKITH